MAFGQRFASSSTIMHKKKGLSEQHTIDCDHRNMLPWSDCEVMCAFTN